MTVQRGRLISVEGIDGSGKGSILPFIKATLEARGLQVICTREPGGTAVGESVRDILLSRATTGLANMSELLLFFAARAQLVQEVIQPALATGKWVLCDRFIDSTYAYQGAGRGVPDRAIEALESIATEGLKPDLTVLLDLPVPVALARAGGRGATDRLETEDLEFFRRVRGRYLHRAAFQPDRIRGIDASGPLESVKATVAATMAAFLSHAGIHD
jgi:thymidylate kinase